MEQDPVAGRRRRFDRRTARAPRRRRAPRAPLRKMRKASLESFRAAIIDVSAMSRSRDAADYTSGSPVREWARRERPLRSAPHAARSNRHVLQFLYRRAAALPLAARARVRCRDRRARRGWCRTSSSAGPAFTSRAACPRSAALRASGSSSAPTSNRARHSPSCRCSGPDRRRGSPGWCRGARRGRARARARGRQGPDRGFAASRRVGTRRARALAAPADRFDVPAAEATSGTT